MLPYVAQGMAQGIEDAGVLTMALSLTDNVKLALRVYELVRKKRGEAIQTSTTTTQTSLHLPDGPAQQSRDQKMRNALRTGSKDQNPDLWSDQTWQNFMWGTDVMKETQDKWDDLILRASGYELNGTSA